MPSTFFDIFRRLTGINREPPASPRQVFERFQAVLRHNNQALEIIADLGEKLGGDYLFDGRYIETAVEELIKAVSASIAALDTLRGPRHQGLRTVYERLTNELRLVLAGQEDRQGPMLIGLDEVRPRDWALVGGKGAHLAEMRHDPQLTVPNGFVVTSRAYHDLIDHNQLRERLTTFETMMADREADLNDLDRQRLELEEAVLVASAPPGLLVAVTNALQELAGTQPIFLAVRSSAQEEDMDFSFAGQFRSVLNVPSKAESIFDACRQVMASLFAAGAVSYRRRIFADDGQMSIAVVCQEMVPAQVSGIAFSVDTMTLTQDTMVIVAAWGQGESVVEGGTPTDTFLVGKGAEPVVRARHLACKEHGLFQSEAGGLVQRPIDPARREQACLGDDDLIRLSRQVCHLETTCKRPQDVEWTIDERGTLFILQARPLVLTDTPARDKTLLSRLETYEIICADKGRVAQQGIGAGPVYIVNQLEDAKDFPEGAVLISRRDSSRFVELMPKAAAIITEIGTPVSHMATICREFQVPCLVNVEGILGLVKNGEVITVDAEDRRIYRGRVADLLVYRASSPLNFMASREFRLLRRLLQKVSLLNLVDPMLKEFSVEQCRTFHDILRFAHETAVQELVNLGRDEGHLLRGNLVRRMALPIPTGILVIDIGGGLSPEAPVNDVPCQTVASEPFRAILDGMLFPDIWHNEPMPVGLRDLMHSMFNPAHDIVNRQYTGHNIAIIGSSYVNLCFRLGYHYNIIDAHCGELEQNNHLYFRFLGGVTDMSKRSRRAAMIATILKAFEFEVQIRGDLVTARLSHLPRQEAKRTLDILGRLVGFTRQLDVRMESDQRAEEYAKAFIKGDYGIVSR